MIDWKSLGLTLSVLAALAVPAAAQCQGPKSVRIKAYGKTCAFFNQHATLKGAYDSRTCTLTLALTKARTCCNTFPRTQLLLFGTKPIIPGQPHPLLLPTCVLSLEIVAADAQPASAGGVWRFRLPPVPVAATVYVQGVNHYFTTIGFRHDLQSSNALQIDIQ